MKKIGRLMAAAWMGIAVAGIACDRQEGPFEETGEAVDEAVDETEDALDDAE